MKKKSTKRIMKGTSIQMMPDMVREIEDVAQQRMVSVSDIVRQAVREFLDANKGAKK